MSASTTGVESKIGAKCQNDQPFYGSSSKNDPKQLANSVLHSSQKMMFYNSKLVQKTLYFNSLTIY